MTAAIMIKYQQMRLPLMAMLLFISAAVLAASRIEVSALSAGEYADTEVSTNVVFRASRKGVKSLDVRIEYTGSESNCVEMAFGRDTDGNGDLSAEEMRLLLAADAASSRTSRPTIACTRTQSLHRGGASLRCQSQPTETLFPARRLLRASRVRASPRSRRMCRASSATRRGTSSRLYGAADPPRTSGARSRTRDRG